jgi:cysteinyl-tRNA synthetase
MEDYYNALEETIALAEELIGVYYYFYGDLATETLDLLYMVEDDLSEMAEAAMALDAALQEIDAALAQGAGVSEEMTAQLIAAAEAVGADANTVQAQIAGLQETVQTEIANRVNEALSAAPTDIPGSRLEAVQAGFAYADSIRAALADSRVMADELAGIAQLGANAQAGLSQLEALDSANLADFFTGANSITANLAGGQNGQAMANLGNLEGTLGALPGAGGFSRP